MNKIKRLEDRILDLEVGIKNNQDNMIAIAILGMLMILALFFLFDTNYNDISEINKNIQFKICVNQTSSEIRCDATLLQIKQRNYNCYNQSITREICEFK